MSTVNSQRGRFFNDWPGKEVGFFTSDDFAFFEEHHALAHAGKLPGKVVDKLTRADYNAWLAADVPARMEAATAELAAAIEEQKTAQAAADGLPAKATAKAKAPVMKALNAANARVLTATQAVEVVKEEVTALDAGNVQIN